MEYFNKFNRGLQLLGQSQTSSELLGLALITIHGALEDYCRHRIASNPKASEQDRSRVQSVKEVQWKQLIDLMKKYENLPEKESRLILKMNQKRQKVGHGHAYTGTRQDLESYAEYVGGLLQVKTPSTYSLKSSPSVPYLREEVRLKKINNSQTIDDFDSSPFEPQTIDDFDSSPFEPQTIDDVDSSSSVPRTKQNPFVPQTSQKPSVPQTSQKPSVPQTSQKPSEPLSKPQSEPATIGLSGLIIPWFGVHVNTIVLFIILGLGATIVLGPIIAIFYSVKIIKMKELVAINTYLLMIVLFLSAGDAQAIFLKKFKIKGTSSWVLSGFVGAVILSYMIINYFPSLIYPRTFFNLKTLAIIANNPMNTLNLWLIPSVITGLILGILQWFILKKESPKAFWWIFAKAAELPLLWLGSITLFTAIISEYTLIPRLEQTDSITLWVLFTLVWPLLCRCITGITLAYILKNRFTNSTTLSE